MERAKAFPAPEAVEGSTVTRSIKMKDGRTIVGEVVAVQPAQVRIRTRDGMTTVDVWDIDNAAATHLPESVSAPYRLWATRCRDYSRDLGTATQRLCEMQTRLSNTVTTIKAIVIAYGGEEALASLSPDIKNSLESGFRTAPGSAIVPNSNSDDDDPVQSSPAESSGLVIGEIGTRVVEEVGEYVKLSWKVEIINHTSEDVLRNVSFRLLDAERYELEEAREYRVLIRAGQTENVTGTIITKADVWERVARELAVLDKP
jgi:hypothetical protein